jgi:hypothetical protein
MLDNLSKGMEEGYQDVNQCNVPCFLVASSSISAGSIHLLNRGDKLLGSFIVDCSWHGCWNNIRDFVEALKSSSLPSPILPSGLRHLWWLMVLLTTRISGEPCYCGDHNKEIHLRQLLPATTWTVCIVGVIVLCLATFIHTGKTHLFCSRTLSQTSGLSGRNPSNRIEEGRLFGNLILVGMNHGPPLGTPKKSSSVLLFWGVVIFWCFLFERHVVVQVLLIGTAVIVEFSNLGERVSHSREPRARRVQTLRLSICQYTENFLMPPERT